MSDSGKPGRPPGPANGARSVSSGGAAVCCVYVAAIFFLASCSPPFEPPNILLISLDALRADHLSSYGYPRETSPFLDELAAKGVRFENAFVNTHGTPPSHATMLSSLYQETHRVSHNEYKGPAKHVVPERLALVQELLKLGGYSTLAVTGGGWVTVNMGFGQGFDEFEEQKGDIQSATEKLIELINAHQGESAPIFAFFHTYQIHSPYAPPEAYRDMFGEFDSEFEPTSGNIAAAVEEGMSLSKEDLALTVARYDGEIRYTDDTLRRMFSLLEESGFLRNSLVVITSDHGEEFADHGGLSHPPTLYEELIRVPLIVVDGSASGGRVSRRLVSSIDIAPTILKGAGLSVPGHMAGQDLLSHADETEGAEAVFSQYGGYRHAVRTRRWKLIETMIPHSFELYDLANDPKERKNLADVRPEQVEALTKRLATWREGLERGDGEAGEKVTLGPEEIERLKSLGYLR